MEKTGEKMIEGITKLKIGLIATTILNGLAFIFLMMISNLYISDYVLFNTNIFFSSQELIAKILNYILMNNVISWFILISTLLQSGMIWRLWKYKRLQRNIMDSLTEEAIAKEGIINKVN